MTKLLGTMMMSVGVAFLSAAFLYSSYVKSALAQNPTATAASIEHEEEKVELIVIEEPNKDDVSESEEDDPGVIYETMEVEIVKKQESERLPEVEISSPEPKTEEEISNLISEKIIEEIHLRSNLARIKRGHAELGFDLKLAELATKRSEDMTINNYFSHTSPDGCGLECNFNSSNYDTLVWGENIAKYKPYDYTTHRVIAEIFVEKWLKSSGHRDNLLSDKFTHHGIGASVSEREIIVTVIFASPE